MSGVLPPSSRGLGLRPFKAATGIRIPLGAQRGGVVKSGVHAGLSSRRSRVQIPSLPPAQRLESCSIAISGKIRGFGQVAQLVEHRSEKPGVGGSSPPLTTIREALLPRRFQRSRRQRQAPILCPGLHLVGFPIRHRRDRRVLVVGTAEFVIQYIYCRSLL